MNEMGSNWLRTGFLLGLITLLGFPGVASAGTIQQDDVAPGQEQEDPDALQDDGIRRWDDQDEIDPDQMPPQEPYQEMDDDSSDAFSGSFLDYFLMEDAFLGMSLATLAWGENNTRILTAVNLFGFFDDDPIALGLSGQMLTYQSDTISRRYSILGFGPALHLGRLVVELQFHFLGFRSLDDSDDTWNPGFSTRLTWPLFTMDGDDSNMLLLVPMPTAGVNVWFDADLQYEQALFWVGFSWPGGIGVD